MSCAWISLLSCEYCARANSIDDAPRDLALLLLRDRTVKCLSLDAANLLVYLYMASYLGHGQRLLAFLIVCERMRRFVFLIKYSTLILIF